MKILISGFMPFGGESMNPSWEAVKALPERLGPEGEILLVKELLPVAFGKAAELLCQKVLLEQPAAVLCIGQAGGRRGITPEKVAINLRDARIPDNEGASPQDEPIVPGGETAYFSTLPVRRMAEALKEAGLEASISYSAGTYVCNDLFYSLMHLLSSLKQAPLGGFIHIPYESHQAAGKPEGTPFMSLEEMVKGLRICVEKTAEALS